MLQYRYQHQDKGQHVDPDCDVYIETPETTTIQKPNVTIVVKQVDDEEVQKLVPTENMRPSNYCLKSFNTLGYDTTYVYVKPNTCLSMVIIGKEGVHYSVQPLLVHTFIDKRTGEKYSTMHEERQTRCPFVLAVGTLDMRENVYACGRVPAVNDDEWMYGWFIRSGKEHHRVLVAPCFKKFRELDDLVLSHQTIKDMPWQSFVSVRSLTCSTCEDKDKKCEALERGNKNAAAMLRYEHINAMETEETARRLSVCLFE